MDTVQNTINSYMPLIIEVRKRLLIVLGVFISSLGVGAFFYERIISLFVDLIEIKGLNLIFSSPFEFMNLSLTCGTVLAIITTLPLIAYQVVDFLRPAVTKKELRILRSFIPFSIILFIFGFIIGFFTMKQVILLSYQTSKGLNIGGYINLTQLLTIVLLTSAMMGIAFQFPIVLTALIRYRIVSYSLLKKQRLAAYVLSVVLASIMPPTDLLSLILLTIPLVFLFELMLVLNRNYK